METILVAATPLAGMLGLVVLVFLRKFSRPNWNEAEAPRADDLPVDDYRRMSRLLDPEDFAYARARGLRKPTLRKLRRVRRKIFRAYLRDIIRDFDRTHRALRLILVQSATDRPDLASELASLALTFYCAVLTTHFRLCLHACGLDHTASARDLFRPIEILQAHIRELSPAQTFA